MSDKTPKELWAELDEDDRISIIVKCAECSQERTLILALGREE